MQSLVAGGGKWKSSFFVVCLCVTLELKRKLEHCFKELSL